MYTTLIETAELAAAMLHSQTKTDVNWSEVRRSVRLDDWIQVPQMQSMNNAPVFPINDAHVFAILMQVLTAPSKAKALRSLPFSDALA